MRLQGDLRILADIHGHHDLLDPGLGVHPETQMHRLSYHGVVIQAEFNIHAVFDLVDIDMQPRHRVHTQYLVMVYYQMRDLGIFQRVRIGIDAFIEMID